MLDVDDINAYFASISVLASKVVIDCEIVKQSCMRNGRWEGLTVEQQEELLDRFMIDQTDTTGTESISCFPVYKINSGEKIVVDFEHDDACTWTDEHSAPFSWKTKSQQDLTLADLDELSNVKDEGKKNRFAKRPRSPDRSVWETSTAVLNSDKNEIEQMFERFGIKASTGDDKSDDGESVSAEKPEDKELTQSVFISPSHVYSEQSKLLGDIASRYENQNLAFEVDESAFVRTSSSCDANTIRNEMFGGNADVVVIDDNVFGVVKWNGNEPKKSPEKNKKKKRDKEKKVRPGKEKQSVSKGKTRLGDMEVSVLKNQPLSLASSSSQFESRRDWATEREISYTPSLGSVSPVYVADPGESSTDDFPAVHGSCLTNIVIADPGESNTDLLSSFSAADNLGLSISDMDSVPPDDGGRDSSTVKTGFDFLDNW